MAQIEFLDRAPMLTRADGYAMLRAANVQGYLQFYRHDRLSKSVGFAWNRLCALPTCEPHLPASSHQALQTMRMTRAAFQAEPILADRAGPVSHTPVSANVTLSHQGRGLRPPGKGRLAALTTPCPSFVHLTNSESKPV